MGNRGKTKQSKTRGAHLSAVLSTRGRDGAHLIRVRLAFLALVDGGAHAVRVPTAAQVWFEEWGERGCGRGAGGAARAERTSLPSGRRRGRGRAEFAGAQARSGGADDGARDGSGARAELIGGRLRDRRVRSDEVRDGLETGADTRRELRVLEELLHQRDRLSHQDHLAHLWTHDRLLEYGTGECKYTRIGLFVKIAQARLKIHQLECILREIK